MKASLFLLTPWVVSTAAIRERQIGEQPRGEIQEILKKVGQSSKGPTTPVADIDVLKLKIITTMAGVQRTLVKFGRMGTTVMVYIFPC